MTDRETAGLRGLVRTCVEEASYSGGKSWTATEYSEDGRLLTTRTSDPDGSEWRIDQAYDSDGRLLKAISGKSGDCSAETVYRYDGAGRTVSIANSENADWTEFLYDSMGHKRATKRFDPRTLQRLRNSGYSCSIWDATLMGFGVPASGTVTTVYDEKDRPVELRVADADGHSVSRVIRTYNTAGMVSEEKPIWENPASLFLGKFTVARRDKLTPERAQLLSKAMSVLLGGKTQAGTAYTYDAQGRATMIRERNMVFERTTTIAYNDQGDKAEESTTTIENSVIPVGVPHSIGENGTLVPNESKAPTPPPIPEKSVIRYFYQYDDHGNWTQQTASATSDGSRPSTVRNRKLTYY